jgi:hypothetical protein
MWNRASAEGESARPKEADRSGRSGTVLRNALNILGNFMAGIAANIVGWVLPVSARRHSRIHDFQTHSSSQPSAFQ